MYPRKCVRVVHHANVPIVFAVVRSGLCKQLEYQFSTSFITSWTAEWRVISELPLIDHMAFTSLTSYLSLVVARVEQRNCLRIDPWRIK